MTTRSTKTLLEKNSQEEHLIRGFCTKLNPTHMQGFARFGTICTILKM